MNLLLVLQVNIERKGLILKRRALPMLFVLKVAACSRIVPRTHTDPQLAGKAPQIALHVPLKLSPQLAQMAYGQRKTLTQDSWYLEERLVSSWKVLCWRYRRWKLHSRTFLRRWGFNTHSRHPV